MTAGIDLPQGQDGLRRCWWAAATDELARYHDLEWARGPRDERSLFERLSLEALQAGLSWRIVLERRETLRDAFLGFVPERLAELTESEVDRILTVPGTIRNRSKVTAIVRNAGVLRELQARGSGLKELTEQVLDAHRTTPPAPPRHRRDVPSSTETSAALARRLRAIGWRFIGPTTAYAYLQAVGWVDDHLLGCHARGPHGGSDGLR